MKVLRDAGRLWGEADQTSQRALAVQVFDRVVVDGPQVAEIQPKRAYAPLFEIDRQERFGGERGLLWLPDEDSNLEPSG